MDLNYILWMYILIFIVLILILMKNDKDFLNSMLFSLVISLLFLIIVKAPNDVSLENDNISCVFIYFAIIFISIITIIFYSGINSYLNLNRKHFNYPYH